MQVKITNLFTRLYIVSAESRLLIIRKLFPIDCFILNISWAGFVLRSNVMIGISDFRCNIISSMDCVSWNWVESYKMVIEFHIIVWESNISPTSWANIDSLGTTGAIIDDGEDFREQPFAANWNIIICILLNLFTLIFAKSEKYISISTCHSHKQYSPFGCFLLYLVYFVAISDSNDSVCFYQ